MRIKPKIEDEINHVFLTRWDQFTSFDPRMVCETCKYYNHEKMICKNTETNDMNLRLYDTDVYSCCLHSYNKKIYPFILDNPYISEFYSDRENLRNKLAKEIDITFYLKNAIHVHINDIELEKSNITKSVYTIFGFDASKTDRFSEKVDNLLTKRIKIDVKINKDYISVIFFYINGVVRVFKALEDFEKYIETIKYQDLK